LSVFFSFRLSNCLYFSLFLSLALLPSPLFSLPAAFLLGNCNRRIKWSASSLLLIDVYGPLAQTCDEETPPHTLYSATHAMKKPPPHTHTHTHTHIETHAHTCTHA